MKILVTGGGGYVGNVLCRFLLDLGHQIRCIDNFQKGQCDALIGLVANPNFEFRYADVSYQDHCNEIVKDVDGIVHLAAIVGFPDCKKQPTLSYGVNVLGTKNMLLARQKNNPNVPFVFASTGSVYGKVEGVCTEDSPRNPQSLYGIHKFEAEQMVVNSENTVSFRFATGFGVSPSMRVCLLVNDLVYQAVTNKCLTIFQADFRRTFIHVKDMARVLTIGLNKLHDAQKPPQKRIFDNPLKYKVYNAGSNNMNWTKRQLAEYIKEKTGCYVTYAEIGKDDDQRDYEVDYSKIRDEGFIPTYDMETGIDELVKVSKILNIRHQYE